MQTTQTQNLTVSLPGMPYGDVDKQTFVSDRVAEAAILMGLFVCAGTTAASQCKLPASAGNVQDTGLGFALYKAAKATAAGVSVAQYEIGEPVSILRSGYVWAFAEEAMAFGDDVFVRITSSGGNTVLGKVRNDADTATATVLPGARVHQACTAAGPVLIEYFPQTP